jgi:hypothetical protein
VRTWESRAGRGGAPAVLLSDEVLRWKPDYYQGLSSIVRIIN